MTSFDCVHKIRSILSKKVDCQFSKHKKKRIKVGHGGTLDKEAEGILVIGVGKGCKKSIFLS